MMRHVFNASYYWSGPQVPKGCGCIEFLSLMVKKIPDSCSKREGGQPREFLSLFSIIDGSQLPQDSVEELPCEVTGKIYNEKKKKSLKRYPT